MPHAQEAESCILGAVLLDNKIMDTLFEKLHPNDFYVSRHRIIFKAMLELYENKISIDYITLESQLLITTNKDEYGGMDYLAELPQKTPFIPNMDNYIKILKDCSDRRALISMTLKLNEQAFNKSVNVIDIKNKFSEFSRILENSQNSNEIVNATQAMEACYKQLEQIQTKGVIGIKTGIRELDEKTAGFQPGNMIIIAGWSSRGKSTLAMNIYRYMTTILKEPALFFSVESNRAAFMNRMFCAQCHINSNRFRNRRLDSSDIHAMKKAKKLFLESPLFLNDDKALTIESIISHVRRAIISDGIKIVFIDYLQLIRFKRERNSSREESISEISREFQFLSSEFNIPFVIVCQLNFPGDWDKKDNQKKQKEKPNAQTQLQYCKKIWHDADLVLTINNEIVNIEKNREGPTGEIQVEHDQQYFLIKDIEQEADDPKQLNLNYTQDDEDDEAFNPDNI